MRTKMTTAMASNRSRKRGNVEVTAEAVVVELAVAAVASIVTTIKSTEEVATDLRLITVRRDPKRLSKHLRPPLLHPRKKKLRFLFLLRDSQAGVSLLSSERFT
jgi:hypothetical protein